MKLDVKILSKDPVEIEVSESATIGELIQRIKLENQIGSQYVKLIYKGQLLKTLDQKLTDAGITDGSRLVMICSDPLEAHIDSDLDSEPELSDELREFILEYPDLIRVIIQAHPHYNDIAELDPDFLDHFMDYIIKLSEGSETDLLESIHSEDQELPDDIIQAYHDLERDLELLQTELIELADYIKNPSEYDSTGSGSGSGSESESGSDNDSD